MFAFFDTNQSAIPSSLKQQLLKKFPKAINVEWTSTLPYFEAVFYDTEIEHLAKYDKTGVLLELKRNLRLPNIPKTIANEALPYGEMMNCIEVSSNDTVFFEIICRNTKHERRILIIDQAGKLQSITNFEPIKSDN